MARVRWLVGFALVGFARCAVPPESAYVGGEAGSDATHEAGPACTGPDTFVNTDDASASFGHCYRYVVGETPGTTWTSAKSDCEQWSGYLASITDNAEEAFVSQTIIDHYIPPDASNDGHALGAWIGLSYDAGVDGYAWSSGEPFVFQNFVAGEPSFDPTQPCVLHHNARLQEHWQDYECDLRYSYICER